MKALFVLPAATLISGCALFAPVDAPMISEEEITSAGTTIVGHRGSAMLVGGDTQEYRGQQFATFVEHDVDPRTGATETTHFVMVEDRALECFQNDCRATVIGYHEGPTYDIAARPAPTQ